VLLLQGEGLLQPGSPLVKFRAALEVFEEASKLAPSFAEVNNCHKQLDKNVAFILVACFLVGLDIAFQCLCVTFTDRACTVVLGLSLAVIGTT
jgi:hypothetical protein